MASSQALMPYLLFSVWSKKSGVTSPISSYQPIERLQRIFLLGRLSTILNEIQRDGMPPSD